MAKVFVIYNPTKVVAADTNANELEFGVDRNIDGASPSATGGKNYDFRDLLVPSPSGKSDERITLLIKVTVGTFQFNVGSDPTANPASFTVGESFTVTIHNRVSNLWFKASAISDAFSVSA